MAHVLGLELWNGTRAWRTVWVRAWRPLSFGRGARSGSGMVEWEGAKNTRIERFPSGRSAFLGRGGRFRLGVKLIYTSWEFAGSSRRLLCGRGARSRHGGRSRLGVLHILGPGWWNGSALRIQVMGSLYLGVVLI